jgi:KDO2-lipid IV(A) lauroyltransferase
VVAARERIGIKVVPLSVNAGRAVFGALRRNEVVALVCDLPKQGRNVPVRLCGQLAMVPAGPAHLAIRSRAPVVPITCRRQPDDHYLLEVQPPLKLHFSGDAERDLPAIAQDIVDAFEATLRRYPEQWYLFSPMWGLIDDLQPLPPELTESGAEPPIEEVSA